jgi:glycosyltransferase involved in cell wall biosynthesis
MRIALLVHAFPPRSMTGVEVYSEALARAFAVLGHEVEVLACERERGALHLKQQREQRDGWGVTWLTLSEGLDDEGQRRQAPGGVAACGRWLDREQPDVLHVQHFLGLGAAVIDEARRRGIPVVFTAHDAFAICDEYTLLGPDMRAVLASDRQALARCRLGRGVLDQYLGAHDGWLLPGDDSLPVRRELEEVMGETSERVDQLACAIDGQLRARLEAVDRADHVEAPTAFLAQKLLSAGLHSKVHVRACGIPPVPVPSRSSVPHSPLRALYLGGYFEHKGVHVLLEAMNGLQDELQLTLRGCHGSSDYIGQLQGLAGDLGVHVGGAFTREELGGLFASADLLVLPSLWVENAPFVIREAFAAGVPVFASDTPALRESVRDGVDGRLLPQGDVSAWREALRVAASDREQINKLKAGVQSPKGIEQDASELLEIYQGLVARAQGAAHKRTERLPEHLRGFAQRHGELEGLSGRELLVRAVQGLQKLASSRGVPLPELEGAVEMLASNHRLRERLAEGQRASEWREQLVEDRARALGHAESLREQAHERASSESQRADWQTQVADEGRETLRAARAELELSERTCQEWLAQLEEAQQAGDSLRKESDWLRESLAQGELEHRSLEQSQEQAKQISEAQQERLDDLEHSLRAGAESHERLQAFAEVLRQRIEASQSAYAELQAEREGARQHESFLEERLSASGEKTGRLEQDLESSRAKLQWRGQEMRRAVEEGQRFSLRFFGRRLGQRLESWGEREGDQQ